MIVKLEALVVSLILSLINLMFIGSQSFCSDGRIDTAFTYDNYVFLFRNNNAWIFDAQNKYVSSRSIPLNDLLVDKRIRSVDTIFDSTNDQITIVYVFQKGTYFLLKPEQTQDPSVPVRFVMFGEKGDQNLPRKWSKYGNLFIDSWFPQNISEAIVVKGNEVYLFHGNKIRYTLIDRDWPEGQKIDYSFSGPLDSLEKIDAAFRLPKSVDPYSAHVVIVEGFRYCQFRRVETNISMDLKQSCHWKDSRDYFRCNNEGSKPTKPSSTDQINKDSTYSSGNVTNNRTNQTRSVDGSDTIHASYGTDGTDRAITNTSINLNLDPAEITDTNEKSDEESSKSGLFLMIVGFVVLVIISTIVLSATIFRFKRNKSSHPKAEVNKVIIANYDSNVEKSSNSKSSVITVNSVTGEKASNI